ncbi:MAG: 1-phosphofructokinase family hexose kinase [Clostridia bacterium]|nr:1-phosphofructokinase family hexose kinase [Clostridia bacterium]
MIYTFTLNPCIDKTYTVENLKEGGFTRAVSSRVDLSGKGVNVSLDLAVLGVKSVATGFMGDADLVRYKQHIESYGAHFAFVPIAGEVRVNCKIIDTVSGLQTDVNESGVGVTENDIKRLNELAYGISNGDTAVISGSAPHGYTPRDLEALISYLRMHGVRVIVDTEKTGLKLAEKYGAFAIKPNYEEFCDFIGSRPTTVREIAVAAVSKAERIANVIVSLGGDGAVFASRTEAYYARVKGVRCRSTTGAGDALLSGFLYGATSGKSYAESIKWALATASAKVECEGTKPPEIESVRKFMNNVTVTKIR